MFQLVELAVVVVELVAVVKEVDVGTVVEVVAADAAAKVMVVTTASPISDHRMMGTWSKTILSYKVCLVFLFFVNFSVPLLTIFCCSGLPTLVSFNFF